MAEEMGFKNAVEDGSGGYVPQSDKGHYILIEDGADVQLIGYFQARDDKGKRTKQGFASLRIPRTVDGLAEFTDTKVLEMVQFAQFRKLSLLAAQDGSEKGPSQKAQNVAKNALILEIADAQKEGDTARVTALTEKLIGMVS